MQTRLALRCSCGSLRGTVRILRPRRVVCYCDDCQLFAHYLQRPDTLDKQGGSDALITSPGCIELTQGRLFLRCLRLSPHGTHRWYAACCNTPLGNTLGPHVPFVSLLRCCIDAPLPPVDERVRARFAREQVPDAQLHASLGFVLRTLWFMLRHWRLRAPFPFVLAGHAPHVLTSAELASLRRAPPTRPASQLERVTGFVMQRCG